MDSIRYLSILQIFEGVLSKNSYAAHDILPHGYPWLLYLLDKFHVLNSFSITLINIISVAISSYLLIKILNIGSPLLYLSLVLICYINIKQFTLGVSDQVFVLIFTLSIYLWTLFFNGRRYLVIPALILTFVGIYIRTAGIALILGIVLYPLYLNRSRVFKNKLMWVVLALFFASFTLYTFLNLNFLETKVDYVRQLELASLVNNPFLIFSRLAIHLQELGEVFINTPYSKLSVVINSPETIRYFLIAAGLAFLYLIYQTVKKLRLINHFIFWALFCYSLMIAVWPFYDTRFLIPVIPLLIYLFIYYLLNLAKNKFMKFVLLGVYITFGMIGLAYSDAISVSKPFFINHYGFDPTLADQYRLHFKNQQLSLPARPMYDITKNCNMFLLEKYDK